ncbi:recombinase family protein [Rhizobium johnstonii]|uniref:recombinase family protein n=1 Tax=Rhizobium johnstonii TaxID=3019933 RepID=UPI003F98B86D
MTCVGYARVSTSDQDLQIQLERLKACGCEIVRSDTCSDASRDGQTELETLLQFLRAGDELVVLRLDRLGRSTRDILNLVHKLDNKGVSLRVLEPEVSTAGDIGQLVITILGMVADMELRFSKDRQRAGIETAKAQGVYKGRTKNIDDDEIRRRVGAGATKAAVARVMNISRMTVYRALDDLPDKTALPDKRPSGLVTLRVIPPDRSVARSRVSQTHNKIEELLERDYAMKRISTGEYRLRVVYDHEPDGMSFNEEIEHLRVKLASIMEEFRCPMTVDIVKGQRRPWDK